MHGRCMGGFGDRVREVLCHIWHAHGCVRDTYEACFDMLRHALRYVFLVL